LLNIIGNRKNRDVALQAGFVAVVAAIAIAAILTTRHNMQVQNISMDWSFLNYATGWNITFSLIPFDGSSTYARALLVGLLNTLFLGSISVSLAVIIGVIVGAGRLASHKLLRLFATTYVQIFRNLPLILQAYFWYTLVIHLPGPRQAISVANTLFISNRGAYLPGVNSTSSGILGALAVIFLAIVISLVASYVSRRRGHHIPALAYVAILLGAVAASFAILWSTHTPDLPFLSMPVLKGLRIDGGVFLPPEVAAAIVAISLFGGSYVAEIVRSGLQAVPRGLGEAAAALGLNSWQTFWKVRLPMAIRIVMPTMTNQVVWLMKATTIGLAIGYRDFFAIVSTSINNSGQTITLILVLVFGFWAINLSIAAAMNWINSAIAIPGRAAK
jgi:His/Glu/Gln/Arg/opine family amino acid ABC transporter permease subunit